MDFAYLTPCSVGLAYDQAGVFTYQTLQLWSQKMLAVLQSDPPAGFAKFTFQQLFEADKFLFGRIAEDTRAKLEQNLPMPDSNTGWSIQR